MPRPAWQYEAQGWDHVGIKAFPSLTASHLTSADRRFLLGLQRQAIQFFLDNQTSNGLFLDRQSNHGPRRGQGLCSLTATGMGCVALALAAAPPYRLLSPQLASLRIRAAVHAALQWLPNDHGVVPHFVHSATNAVHGEDHFSTIESAWLAAGGLWASAFLQDHALSVLANRFYDRIDWQYWTASQDDSREGRLLCHGKNSEGRFLQFSWDRLNGETIFMVVLAAGAQEERALLPSSWSCMKTFHGTVEGLRFASSDLGLFVFQYGLDLLDLDYWQAPDSLNLNEEARIATRANHLVCKAAAQTFVTFRRFWGLSAGDGPAQNRTEGDTYRCYSPSGPIDGTAHLMATLASVAHDLPAVLENLHQAEWDSQLRAHGRYGFSNVNVDHNWVSQDIVGIDAGAAVLALDNYLMEGRVRQVFHSLPCVRRGLERLGFVSKRLALSRAS